MRICTLCQQEKQASAFSKSAVGRDGLHTWCKSCKAARSREWFAKNRERELAIDRQQYAADGSRERELARKWHHDNRERSLQNKKLLKLLRYGLTLEAYEALVAAHGGQCAICGRNPEAVTVKRREFMVDHDHGSGLIRGLLCHHCNVGLGHFYDSPELLRAAADYLERVARKKTA